MVKRPPEMTPAEFDVMKALWRLKSGAVADIRAEHARMFASHLAYTTIMTLLGRLAGKGAVHVDKTRQPFLYKPAFQRESVLRARLRDFVDTVFDGRADSLVLHLLDDESLSLDELKRIEARAAGDDAADDDDHTDDTDGEGEP
jgi:predicted transcriptional regulator